MPKMVRVKERGGVGKKGKEPLAEKQQDFENRPLGLSCLSAHTDTDAVISCHKLTNKTFGLPWSGSELSGTNKFSLYFGSNAWTAGMEKSQ